MLRVAIGIMRDAQGRFLMAQRLIGQAFRNAMGVSWRKISAR